MKEFSSNPLALSVFRDEIVSFSEPVEKNVSNGCGFKNKATILSLCIISCVEAVQMQTVKLRIGNPYDHGIIVTRMSSVNPHQLLSVDYLPPKGGRYFNGSLDVYVVPTDLVGLWATALDEKATDQDIDTIKGKAVFAFAEGKFSVWRIEQIKIGLTKVFVTAKELDPTLLAMIPNGPIQAGSVPEITFNRWYDAT